MIQCFFQGLMFIKETLSANQWGILWTFRALSLTVDYVFDFLWACETVILIPDINYTVENVKDHRDIVEYLKKRDGEKCEKLMLQHLRRLDGYLIEMGKRVPQGAEGMRVKNPLDRAAMGTIGRLCKGYCHQ